MGLVLHHELLKGQRWFNGMWQLSWAQVTWSRSKGSWKGYWDHPPHSCQHRLYAVWFHAGKRDIRPNFHLETVAWEVLREKEGPVFSFHWSGKSIWSCTEKCNLVGAAQAVGPWMAGQNCAGNVRTRTPSLLYVSTAATVQNSMSQLVCIKDLYLARYCSSLLWRLYLRSFELAVRGNCYMRMI